MRLHPYRHPGHGRNPSFRARSLRRALPWPALALITAVLVAAPARAQGLAVGGGRSTPTGDLADVVDSGFHALIATEFEIPLIPVGLGADLMVQNLPGRSGGDDFRQLSGTLNARFGLLPIPLIALYAVAGVGLYVSGYDPDPDEDGDWQASAGLNGGLGASIGLGAIRPFVEARYHRVMTSPARSFIPITFGIFF